jgi:hypothetical protein
MRPFPLVWEDQFTAQLDLIAVRALLHHLPERRGVARMVRWLKPGG